MSRLTELGGKVFTAGWKQGKWVHAQALGYIIALFALTWGMLWVNVNWGPTFVLPMCFIGIVLIVWGGLSPRKFAFLAGLEFLWEQPSFRVGRAAVDGGQLLVKIVSGATWLWCALSGVLAIVPFDWWPALFWYLSLGVLTMGALVVHYNTDVGDTVQKVIGRCATMLMVGALLLASGAKILDLEPLGVTNEESATLADVMKKPGFEIRVIEGVAVIVYTEVGALPVEPTLGSQLIFLAEVDMLVKIPDQGCLRFDSFADQAELEARTEYFPELRLYKIKASPKVTSISALPKSSPTCTGG